MRTLCSFSTSDVPTRQELNSNLSPRKLQLEMRACGADDFRYRPAATSPHPHLAIESFQVMWGERRHGISIQLPSPVGTNLQA